MKENYKNWMYHAREGAKKDAGVTRMDEKCKDFSPDWISPLWWNSLVDHWMGRRWKEKSKAASQNRQSDEHVTYTGGSRPISKHVKEMAKEYNRQPSQTEIFKKTHFKKNEGKWASQRSKRIAEDYNSKLETCSSMGEGSGEASRQNTPPPDNIDAWINIVGGAKKGRVLGFGPESSSVILGSAARPSSTRSVSSCVQPQAENSEAERLRQTLLKDVQGDLRGLVKDIILEMAQAMGWPIPPPQTNDFSSRAEDDGDAVGSS